MMLKMKKRKECLKKLAINSSAVELRRIQLDQ